MILFLFSISGAAANFVPLSSISLLVYCCLYGCLEYVGKLSRCLGSYGTGRLGDSAVSKTILYVSCVFLDAKLEDSCKRSRGFPVICICMLSTIFFLVGFYAMLDSLKFLLFSMFFVPGRVGLVGGGGSLTYWIESLELR
jgi:hypothetical protein